MSNKFVIGDFSLRDPHICADLIELLVFIDYKGNSTLHQNDFISVIFSNQISINDIDEIERDISLPDSIRNDRVEKKVEDVWMHLEFRQKRFGSAYPFFIKDDTISFKQGNMDLMTNIYLILLICSRLKSFMKIKGFAQHFATIFTDLSKFAMQGMLPQHAKTYIFDANSEDRKFHFGTKLPRALRELGKNLQVSLINEFVCDKQSNSGDAGIDIVGVIDFSDSACSNFALLGQCAARCDNWPAKIFEASPIRLRPYFNFYRDFPSVLFIPHCYRNTDGNWINEAKIAGAFVIDRIRMLYLLKKTDKGFIENEVNKLRYSLTEMRSSFEFD